MLNWIRRLFGLPGLDERTADAADRRIPVFAETRPGPPAASQAEVGGSPMKLKVKAALSSLPDPILFVDVETTGLHSDDRVVSVGAILWEVRPLYEEGVFTMRHTHQIFDPGRKSHPRAAEVHGYDDWLLRHQEPFHSCAPEFPDLVKEAKLIVAHNAEFDLSFLKREFERAGFPPIETGQYCTMTGYRASGLGGSASLSAVARRFGLKRASAHHSAMEDAWLAMAVFMQLRATGIEPPPLAQFGDPRPKNLKEAPPMPDGPLPRRKRITKPKPQS